MDAESSTALVKQAWAYVAAGDIPGFLALLDEQVEWIIPEMPAAPFAGTWTGREQVARFFAVAHEAQEPLDFTPETFIAQDDKVVVLGQFTNRVRTTGQLSRSDWAQVWTVAEGRIAAMREYVDTLAVNRAFSEQEETEACGPGH